MRKINLGRTIAVLANLGVIVGIAFLVVEIDQNTQVLESQMRFTQSERETEVIEELFRNPTLMSAYVKFENGEELDRIEDLALSAFAQRVFTSFRWIWQEVEIGAMPLDPRATFRRPFHNGPAMDRTTDFYRHYWERYDKTGLDEDFVRFMEQQVVPE